MAKHIRLICLSIALILLSTGCNRTQPPKQDELNVAAASNLTDAFTELGKEFTARTGVKVVYSFGATADLAKQIENHAPFDVFASADVENVDKLASKALLTEGTRQLYARGRLVLWVPPDSRLALARLEDLSKPEVEHIGIAKPEVAPYGRATVEALRALNLWPQL
ncbi:MAG: molybdate ABC transporter substrate-binding protein, partial [Acidobacteria bacterium]|nr:molybdate ABC transporter substrate-binding protein [Acidobacteriota bacterium]